MTTPPPTPSPKRPPERIPDELVDRFFDRELDEGSREKFFKMIRGDLSRCAEVAKTQRIVSMLREPVEAPDLTEAILGEVRRRRGFLPARLRRMVKAGRLAVAASLLLGILGIALANRYAPGVFRLTPRAAPISGVIKSSTSELAGAVDSVKTRVPEAQRAAPASPGKSRQLVLRLTPGKTSVKLLPPASSEVMSLAQLGSGGDVRFVLVDGVCIDRGTSTAMAFGLLLPPRPAGGECSDVWIQSPFPWPAIPPAMGAGDAGKEVRESESSR